MKKYILKPGIHQFAPGSPPTHTNENLTDEEAEWYLKKYPHIKTLFADRPGGEIEPGKEVAQNQKSKIKQGTPNSSTESKEGK
ncbi:hypothetical protein [Mucilaginibacter sp.]|uniref:hypothetical protein n=1 Tax=Mucilaginibacter sp. TaxID=1882438 RepID=UPI000CBF9F1B|nr:hypothetical protein [Mucilaginibacter sp.]PLW90744.1 MAG: hypothetical protein C0154_04975 [Mucilaginibacter sp.]PMP64857.1 MAG: hypothetical protein C0191_05290 [Mucilaginibacter sp.]HEK20015.1 hypothetical protein [Bacteroidota bacterium]